MRSRAFLYAAMGTLMTVTSGCLSGGIEPTTGHLEYTPPKSTALPSNTVVVEKPFNTVWKEIIPALGSRFFVINSIDKESGLINVGHSADPEAYVDCGHVKSWVADERRGRREYSFPGSSVYQAWEWKGQDGGLFVGERRITLEIRANLILEDRGSNRTRATVNARYVLTRTGHAEHKDVKTLSFQGSDTIAFNSGKQDEFPRRTVIDALTCRPTGKFETEVIDFLRRL
jgi:hypothetical protein